MLDGTMKQEFEGQTTSSQIKEGYVSSMTHLLD
jgi:hypothetical protein